MLKVITVTNPFIRCRTCFAQTNGEVYTRISNVCYLNKSVKEVITMLVPQMGKTLDDEDFTCKNCFEILKNCMIFIEKCLEVERKLEANRQILNLYSNESEGAVTIRGPEKTSQTLLNIYANLRGDSTFEKSVQEMGGLVLLVPRFSGNNVPVEKTNCNVNLLPNLENATNVAHVNNNEDNLQNYFRQAELLNGKDHNRVLTLEQPSGKVVLDFISYLLQSEIKVLQISKNSERSLSSTKKRILLLGKTDSLKCPYCLICFESSKIYNKHIKCQGRCQKEQKVMAPHTTVCRLCDKKVEAHQIKLHTRQHELEQRRERRQNKLMLRCQTSSEMLTHLKMKPFKCKICGKAFGEANCLRNHVKTHTGESLKRRRIEYGKQVACKFCGKCIATVNNLRKHLKTHIKTRRYSCQFCPLTFAEAQFRRKHELIHQNVDSIFRCNICYKRFKTIEEMDEHIITHKNPKYACDTCGQLFHRKYLLDHHNSQEHVTTDDLEEMINECLLEGVGLTDKS